jgi:arylsulfatase A-like enzyme
MENQKSLVLVTVDCLRADHVGFMGYQRPTTPFLDQLAAESFVVPSAMVAGAPTYYSLPAIHASRYPLALGRDILGIGPDETTLASTLRAGGYATAAFGAANPYISARFGYDQGFETFQDFLSGELKPLSVGATVAVASNGRWTRLNQNLSRLAHAAGPLGRVYDSLYFEYCERWATPRPQSLDELRRFPSADVIVGHALDWFPSAGNRPFFLWLHLMDPHAPYYPKSEALDLMRTRRVSPFQARYVNSSWNRSDLSPSRLRRHREEVIDLYDAGIRWVDEQLARLVVRLRESGRWESCAFALTADHGEEFLEHGGRFHPPSSATEEIQHVPLFLRVPGVKKRAVTSSVFSLLHLAPTLLDIVGISVPHTFEGESHWKSMRDGGLWDEPAIAESIAECTNPFRHENRFGSRVLVVRQGHMKLVLQLASGAAELYDLQADPGGTLPLPLDAQKSVRRRLLEAARNHLQSSRSRRDSELRLRSRLRDLQLDVLSKAAPCGGQG